MVIERARLRPLPQEHNGKYKAKDNIIKEDYTWEKNYQNVKIIIVKHPTSRVFPFSKATTTFSWRCSTISTLSAVRV